MSKQSETVLVYSGEHANTNVVAAAIDYMTERGDPEQAKPIAIVIVPDGGLDEFASVATEICNERGIVIAHAAVNQHANSIGLRALGEILFFEHRVMDERFLDSAFVGIVGAERVDIGALAELAWDAGGRNGQFVLSTAVQPNHGIRDWVRPWLDAWGKLDLALNGSVHEVRINRDGSVSALGATIMVRYSHGFMASEALMEKIRAYRLPLAAAEVDAPLWMDMADLVEFDGGWCYGPSASVDLRAATGIAARRDEVHVQLPRGFVPFATHGPLDAERLARVMMEAHRVLKSADAAERFTVLPSL